jgi:hypothetical protein
MDEEDLLDKASDQLNRVLGFFPRVDAKASVVLAVDSGMLAFLATHVPQFNALSWWELMIPAVSVLLTGASLWFLYRGAFPRLQGGAASLVYFREIAGRTEAKFIDEFAKQTSSEHARDILGQVWRNSEILKLKFDALKTASVLLALSIPPWVISLVIFSIKASTSGATGNH